VQRLGPLDLVALGLGAAAAALGIAAGTGPVLPGIAVAVALARVVRARTMPHAICWIVVPLLIWIGFDSWTFLGGTACLFGESLIAALAARGRPEHPQDIVVASRVTLSLAAAVTAVALLAFGNIYS
jgi:hypothetical protein